MDRACARIAEARHDVLDGLVIARVDDDDLIRARVALHERFKTVSDELRPANGRQDDCYARPLREGRERVRERPWSRMAPISERSRKEHPIAETAPQTAELAAELHAQRRRDRLCCARART